MESSTFERAWRRVAVARTLVAVTLGALAVSGPALAEAARSNEAVRSAARTKLVEGVEALRRGNDQMALERFQEAYALIPSPKIHYDFGLAYLGLGRRAEALSAFERFLAEAQDAPADKRDRATQQTEVLRAQLGAVTVAVEGEPPGTAIVVDGREVGPAPSVRSLYVEPGWHQISLRLPGGRPGPVERIEIRAGGHAEVGLRASDGGPAVAGSAPARTGPSPPQPAVLAFAAPSAGQAATVPPSLSVESPGPVERHGRNRQIAALSLGAAGVVLLGAGVMFGILAQNEGDSLSRDSVNGTPPHMATTFDPDKESRGIAYETVQVIGLATGAVALVAGVVLYATTRGRVAVEPVAVRSQMGPTLRLSF